MSIRYRQTSLTLTWLASCLWFLPPSVFLSAGEANKEAPPVRDIRLNQDHSFEGRLLDLEGEPVAGKLLRLQQSGREITRTTSRDDGQFRFRKVPAGLCQIRFDDYAVTCRVWTTKAAPPVAKDQLIVLAEPPTVRGQQPASALLYNPLVYGTLIAAAIAIPIAVHNSNDDKPSGS
jgi:hypothetical protein